MFSPKIANGAMLRMMQRRHRPFLAGRPPGPDRAPVVGDEDRLVVAAGRLVQGDLVGGYGAGVHVVAVIGKLGRREPAVERATARYPASASAGSR